MRNKANNPKVPNFWILCINSAGKKQNRTCVSLAHPLLEKPKGSSVVLHLTEGQRHIRPSDPVPRPGFPRQQSTGRLCLFCEMNRLGPMLSINCFCSPKTKCPSNSTSTREDTLHKIWPTTRTTKCNNYCYTSLGCTYHILKCYVYLYDLHWWPNRCTIKIRCWANEWTDNK